MTNKDNRPVFLDLKRIHMPITALMSIGHRVAGILMCFFIPLLAYLITASLSTEAGFNQVKELFCSIAFRGLIVLMLWALAHHLLAGIRYLLLDLDIGVEKSSAVFSAKAATLGGVLLAVVFAVMLL